jgi:AraC-like DNA-binding protein
MILDGHGMRYIGDHVGAFETGDLVFTGPNVPHLWRSDAKYFEEDSILLTHGMVLYFDEALLQGLLSGKERFGKIDRLLKNAMRGVHYSGAARDAIRDKMKAFDGLEGFARVVHLFELLDFMSRIPDFQLLAGSGYKNTLKGSDAQRMEIVHDYVSEHFHEEVSVSEVAELLHMTPSSFCRYFKPRANKTFGQFVTDIRIGHAKKLLVEDDMGIAQISFECGFNALSNFNKQFKNVTGKRPSEYRKLYQGLA